MAFAADVRPRVKILVLGDAAVGKSALCALLAHAVQVADGASYSATVGVEPEVLVRTSAAVVLIICMKRWRLLQC